MKTKHILLSLVLLGCLITSNAWADSISAKDAVNFVGQNKTVCGQVASTFYGQKIKGQPTFINLDQAYPNQIFTALIWGSDRYNFQSPPEDIYKNKNICVSGVVKIYKGKTEIIVKSPQQIKSN